jgi:hypothetical protein
MKTLFRLLIVSMAILAIQSSCKKTNTIKTPQQPKPPIALDSMLLCYGQTSWDSTSITNALVGKWLWEYIKCYSNPENANNEDFKSLSIEFKLNNTLEVTENGLLTQTSSWNVVRLNDGYFMLLVTPIVLQLPGKVIFCGNRVLFYDSYVDGCDNYFKKQN